MKRLISAAAVGVLLLAFGGAGAGEAASTLPTLSIAMNGTTIAVGGSLQSGAVNVVSTTTNEKEGAPLLLRLNPGVSVEQVNAFLTSKAGADPNNAGKVGSIVFDAEAPPGTSEAQTDLQPGLYMAFDASGENASKWARTSFTIQAAAAPALLPASQATIRTVDFGFHGPSTLHDGELVRFENEGFLVHMNIALKVKNVKSAKKLVKLMRAGKEKLGQKLIVGAASFAGPLSSGAAQQLTVNAKPGVYVEACFMETQDGRSHTRLGMERILRVVR